MLDDIKDVLRASGADLDIEIQDLIDSAKADLTLSGVNAIKIVDTDMLIKRAIILYCKANFGYDEKEADRFMASYISLKQHLCISQEYSKGYKDGR